CTSSDASGARRADLTPGRRCRILQRRLRDLARTLQFCLG
ncbi:MAG: hypothetical protein AVDCRST_MAG67-1638, partial [uncultured Solirubrobacteraceae bacterium]